MDLLEVVNFRRFRKIVTLLCLLLFTYSIVVRNTLDPQQVDGQVDGKEVTCMMGNVGLSVSLRLNEYSIENRFAALQHLTPIHCL